MMEEPQFDLDLIFRELTTQYQDAVSHNDAQALNQFLGDKRVILLKEKPAEYLQLREHRATAFSLFGDFAHADKEYKMALPYCSDSNRWEVLLQRALLHYFRITVSKDGVDREQAITDCLMHLKSAEASIPNTPDREFNRLTVGSLTAFVSGITGDIQEITRDLLRNYQFNPVPIPQYNDKTQLIALFSHLFKGIAVAIESKNRELMRKLLTVISIDDQTLYGESNFFKLFWTTMNNTMDMRPEFSNDFNQMFKVSEKIKPGYSNLRYFLNTVNAAMQDALNLYFEEFK